MVSVGPSMAGRCEATLNPARRSSVRSRAAAIACCRSLASNARRLLRPILDAGARSTMGTLAVWSQRTQLKSNQTSTSFRFALPVTRNLYAQRKHRRPPQRGQNLKTLSASEGRGETDQTKWYSGGFRSVATGSPRGGGRPRRDPADRGRPQIHCCLWGTKPRGWLPFRDQHDAGLLGGRAVLGPNSGPRAGADGSDFKLLRCVRLCCAGMKAREPCSSSWWSPESRAPPG